MAKRCSEIKVKRHKCPKWAVPLDMRPCPTCLTNGVAFHRRTPTELESKFPQQARSKRPWYASRRLTKLLSGCVAGTKCPLSDPPKVMSSRRWTSGAVQRRGNEGVLKTKKAWAAARATSPLSSTAALELLSQDGGQGVIKAQPYSRGAWWSDLRNPPTYSPGGSWCREIPKHPVKLVTLRHFT